ncbi:MAG: ABC transporter substrate-binding protein [Firmicutes bacterium]|nr:ABC transporter substrate-binding protein [Bacillota bacterium]
MTCYGGNSNQHTKITVVLDWTPNTNHTGLFVAKEKGYFEAEGLDVEFVQPPENGATSLVASGKAQFGIDFQDNLASAFAADIPVTAVAAVLQHNTSGIISLKDKNITSPKDLENRSYAPTWNLDMETAIIKHCMEVDGADFGKVNIIPDYVTNPIAAVQTNIDSTWIYYGWDGIAAKVNNVDANFFYFKDIDPTLDYYTPVIVGNNDFIKNNSDVTKKFLAACEKGYTYAVQSPDESADILVKEDPSIDPKLAKESQEWMSSQYIDEGVSWGYIDASRWNNFYKWLYDNGIVDKQIQGGFTNEYLK